MQQQMNLFPDSIRNIMDYSEFSSRHEPIATIQTVFAHCLTTGKREYATMMIVEIIDIDEHGNAKCVTLPEWEARCLAANSCSSFNMTGTKWLIPCKDLRIISSWPL